MPVKENAMPCYFREKNWLRLDLETQVMFYKEHLPRGITLYRACDDRRVIGFDIAIDNVTDHTALGGESPV